MKRDNRLLPDFPEQTRLQLQHVVPEPQRARVHGEKAAVGAERLFAIRGALLEQAADPRVPHSNVTRH